MELKMMTRFYEGNDDDDNESIMIDDNNLR